MGGFKIKGKKILIGAKKGITMGVAFFPFAFTFGFIASKAGLQLLTTTLMSVIIYAGSSQVLIIKLLQANASTLQIILASAIINIRYALINITILNKQKKENNFLKVLNAFFLTDECVSYYSINKLYNIYETIGFGFCAYAFFCISTMLGSIFGSLIPLKYTNSLNFILYAIFLYLLLISLFQNFSYISIVILSIVIKIVLSLIGLSQSITMLLTIIIAPLIIMIVEEKFNE